MAPIPLRQSNSTVSSARVPNGTHGTARISTGIRAANNDPGWNTSLASPPLIATLAVLGLLSLTIFSIFGRRLLQADRRRRRSHGQGMDSETSGTADNHYLLADFLGLNLGHMRRRMSQPSVLDIPKIWDIQCQGGAPGLESYKGHLSSWGDIMPITAMVSEEERCPVRDSTQATPIPRSDQRTCHLLPIGETEEAAQDEQRDGEARSRVLTRRDIQVVVAIAMPCRPRRDQDVHLNFAIGVHTTPWKDRV